MGRCTDAQSLLKAKKDHRYLTLLRSRKLDSESAEMRIKLQKQILDLGKKITDVEYHLSSLWNERSRKQKVTVYSISLLMVIKVIFK